MTEPDREFLTTKEVAAWLDVNESTVLRAVRAGELPGRKLGKAWRFSRTALLEAFRTPSPHPADDEGDEGEEEPTAEAQSTED